MKSLSKSWQRLFMVLFFVLSLAACGGGGGSDTPAPVDTTTPPTDTTPPPSAAAQAVTGTVVDPTSSAPIAGANVSAYVQLSNLVRTQAIEPPVATATTDSSGNYSLSGLDAAETYYVRVEAANYEAFTYYDVQPDASSVTTLEQARTIPSNLAGQTTTVSGKVVNASTNEGLPGMTIKLRVGVNNRTGTQTIATSTTGANGEYEFTSLAAGSYTAEINGNIGTAPVVTSFGTVFANPAPGASNTNQNFPVTAGVDAGQYRIVLSWGDNPSDLDSHLTGPTADGSRFHVYYSADDYPSGTAIYSSPAYTAGPETEAFLDIDNTEHGTNNGPETTTIVVPRAGTYSFFVHHFSGDNTISGSGAQVKIYNGASLLATYNPPSGAVGRDDVWGVFTLTISGSGGQSITPINQIFVGAGYSNLDGLLSGSTGTFTNRLLVGSEFDGSTVTGTASSFSLSSLANGGDLYAHIESGAAFENKFARLYINDGIYGQKDYCPTCNSQPLLNGTNLKVGLFRITDPGTYTLKAYAVEEVGGGIGNETLLGTKTISISQ